METCRSCLSEYSDSSLIFSLLEPVLKSKYVNLTSVLVTAEDYVTTKICLICKQTLDLFSNFKMRSITSDQFLRERTIKQENLAPSLHHEVVEEDETTNAKATKRKRTSSRKQATNQSDQSSDSNDTNHPQTHHLDPICDDNVVSEIELPLHVTRDSQNDKKLKETANVFICSKCPRRFPKITGLKRHQKLHQNLKIICDDCGKVFASKESLHIHKRHVHLQLRPYKCVHCELAFKNKSGMLEHTRNLHSEERNFICEICSSTFKTQNRLNGHIKNVHEAQKVIKCPKCELQVKNKHVLAAHYRNLHTDIRPFICHLCDRGFGRKNSLEKHMKVHKSGKFRRREFRCELCEKMFVSANSLRGHNRNIHQSEASRSAEEEAFNAASDVSSEES